MKTADIVIAGRRTTIEQYALNHIRDRTLESDREKIVRIIAKEAAVSPAFARRRAIIARARSVVNRRSNIIAVSGSLSVVATAAAVTLVSSPAATQFALILLSFVTLGLYGLLLRPGRPNTMAVAIFWAIVSLLPFAGLQTGVFDVLLLSLGWVAIGARGWLRGKAHDLDLDEIRLMLDALGREAHEEQTRRRVLAAI